MSDPKSPPKKLVIKSFPDYFEYTPSAKSLDVYHWNFFLESHRKTVYYEEIGLRYEVQRSAFLRANFFGVFMITILLMVIPMAMIARVLNIVFVCLFLLGILLWVKSRIILLQAKPEPLIFPCPRGKQQSIDAFVKEMIQHIKNYFKWKYGQIDEDLPIDTQIIHYKWLRDQDIITDQEYIALKQKIKIIFEKQKPPS